MFQAEFSFWKEFLAKISQSGPMTGVYLEWIFSALRPEPLLLPEAQVKGFHFTGLA